MAAPCQKWYKRVLLKCVSSRHTALKIASRTIFAQDRRAKILLPAIFALSGETIHNLATRSNKKSRTILLSFASRRTVWAKRPGLPRYSSTHADLVPRW